MAGPRFLTSIDISESPPLSAICTAAVGYPYLIALPTRLPSACWSPAVADCPGVPCHTEFDSLRSVRSP
ncbi:hypothetical protein LMG27177_02813 [Paraburkholderia fynbosensis]|uniref:Uncharacterized protein n=1 Tax=Paraburkholderia fynbosensis TaxID=1200993 RepID=A0A6J5G3D8_9BURK|nr:hypothetical protein LMG27177_02813 [Paraburkholderia fynbosensis]